MKRRGRFAARNAGQVSRPVRRKLHDAHVSAWYWSEERAARAGYLAVIDGKIVNGPPHWEIPETTIKAGPIARYVRMCIQGDTRNTIEHALPPTDISITAAMLGLAYANRLPADETDRLLDRAIDSERRDAEIMRRGCDAATARACSAAVRGMIDSGLAEAHAASAS